MDALNTISHSTMDLFHHDLDDKEVITTVGGVISYVAAYQQFQDYSNDTGGDDITVIHEEKTLWINFLHSEKKV